MSAKQNMLNNLQKNYATYPNTKILSNNSLSHTYPDSIVYNAKRQAYMEYHRENVFLG